MDKETTDLIRYAIDSLFWVAMVWIIVGGIFRALVATKITSKF